MRNLQLAVLCCVAGGVAQIGTGALAAVLPGVGFEDAPVAAWSLVLVVVHLSRVVGLFGLAWAGRLGSSRPARAGFWVAATGLALFVPAEVLYLTMAGWRSALDATLYPAATVLAGVGLVMVGVSVLRAGRWSGAGRFTPLLTGIYVFVAVLPAVAAAGPVAAVLAIGGWGVCWILLGLALRPVGERTSGVPAVAGGVR